MAVPKKKPAKSQSRRREHMWQGANARRLLAQVHIHDCPECGAKKRLHHVCPACGMYRGRSYTRATVAPKATVVSHETV